MEVRKLITKHAIGRVNFRGLDSRYEHEVQQVKMKFH